MSEVCKCCGQTLPPPLPDLKLPAGYQIIVSEIHKAGKRGIRSDRLFNAVYRGPDGGPDGGQHVLTVRIWFLNKRHLKKAGLKIVGERTSSGQPGHYRIVDVV